MTIPLKQQEGGAAVQPPTRASSRWLMGLAKTARWPLLLAVAAPLLSGALLVVQAWYLADLLDAAIVRHASRQTLIFSLLTVAGLIALRAGLAWAGERAGAFASEQIKHQVRQGLFEHLLAQSPSWSRAQVSGELASAIVDQVEALDGFFSKYLAALAAAALLPIAFSVLLLPIDVVVGLVLLVSAPLIPVFMALIGRGAQSASRRHFRAFARLTGFFADRLRGLSTLKMYGQAEAEAQVVVAASDALRQRTLSVLRIAFLSSAVLEFFAALGVAGVAVYIGLSYLGFLDLRWTPLSLQAGLFCLLMAPEVYAPLRQFAAHYHDRAAALAAVTQIDLLFEGLPDARARVRAPEEPAVVTSQTGTSVAGVALVARHLCLRAPNRPLPILSNASLLVAPGEHVALMGASGIGKSSLLESLARLRPCEGEMLLDNVALSAWPEAALRTRVAWIGQHPQFLMGSIADNIRLGHPQATDEAVHEAARRAGVLRFTQGLPQGLQTLLGVRGHGISGGQAQRVALARLFLRNPGLILLDEPTAHLDEATQADVLDEILAFSLGRTLILSTHSEQVAARFTRVLQLQAGVLKTL